MGFLDGVSKWKTILAAHYTHQGRSSELKTQVPNDIYLA